MFITLFVSALLSHSSNETDPRPAVVVQDEEVVTYPHWKGTLGLGALWTDGNSETAGISGTFLAERRGEKDRWTLEAFANYAENTDDTRVAPADKTEVTVNNYGGGAKYDYFHSAKTYVFGNGAAKVDHIADLDHRAILGAGLGYQWKETETLQWGTEIGLSYVDENFEGTVNDTDFLAVRAASNLDYKISKSASFVQRAEVLPSLEDSDDVIANVDNILQLNITGSWIAQIQYVLNFDGSVPSGNDEADHRVVLTLNWSFGEG